MRNLALLAAVALPLWAGVPQPSAPEPALPKAVEPELLFRAITSYEFEADIDGRGGAATEAVEARGGATLRLMLTDNWRLSLGGAYARFDFAGAISPIPETLEQVTGEVGIEYLYKGRRALFINARPGFYYTDGFETDAFDIPAVAATGYPLTRNLIVSVGAIYSQFRDTPVLPIAGMIWDINDRLVLNLIAPEPALTYRFDNGTELSLKGEMIGTTVRVGDDLPEPYRGENLDYLNLRTGLSVKFGNETGWEVEADAGWSFYRRFDYDDLDRAENLDGTPYLRLALRWSF